MTIHPVILSGGAGSRLWPLSTPAHPKQLHALTGSHTLIQQTALRFDEGFAAPRIIANRAHADEITKQLSAIERAPARLILEPCPRNTAPAIAAAALDLAQAEGADALMLVLPADHVISRTDLFCAAVEQGKEAAARGHLVSFGVVPDHPHTGYGYIKRGPVIDEGAFAIDRFVEKPDFETAQAYLESGDYWWNAGIFLWTAGAVLHALETYQPDCLTAARTALEKGQTQGIATVLDDAAFQAAPSISIDYAVMEKTDLGGVVPLAGAGWSDIGAWDAVADLAASDENGNAILSSDARVLFEQASNVLVHGLDKPVALVGVSNLVVIDTPDGLLVLDKDHAQSVKTIVEKLKD